MSSQQSLSPSPSPSPKLAGFSIAALVALASVWFRQQHTCTSTHDVPFDIDEQAMIELEVANGWRLRGDAVPSTLTDEERSRFALVADGSHRRPDSDAAGWYKAWHGVVPGGAGWDENDDDENDAREEVRSPWAVWTTSALLTTKECAAWVKRAEELELETGDFVFAGGSWGLSRISTGARRHSATRLVVDEEFASLMTKRLAGQGLPAELADGRKYGGIGSSFLVSKYEKGQYFAPHFDGRGSGGFYLDGYVAEFTVVLYLTDDFSGGATHYLPGQGSEVAEAVALRPTRGCAAVHRQGTVLHSGGALLEGTKYIMQFFPYYEAPTEPEPRPLTNLRWGA